MSEEERNSEICDLNTALRKYGKPAGMVSFDNADKVIYFPAAKGDENSSSFRESVESQR
ncbi:hypothetical protein [Bradyrhizobium ganzhouense]|uniref:hypothetical protein n=1 Tax=Bradyrhizobium ganzhouense TaxID=1179767 RepID=UPI003CF6F879